MDEIILLDCGRCKNPLWHTHLPEHMNRIYYINDGIMYYGEPGQEYEFRKGYLYFLPQNMDFVVRQSREDPVDHTFIDFITFPPVSMDHFIEIAPNAHPLLQSSLSLLSELIGDHDKIAQLYDRAPLIKSYTYYLLELIHEIHPIGYLTDLRILKVIEYMQTHFRENIRIRELAGLVNLDENYLFRLFRKTTSLSPHQYLKTIRICHCINLLRCGYSVSEAAEQSGYGSVSSFSQVFKKETGKAPSELLL